MVLKQRILLGCNDWTHLFSLRIYVGRHPLKYTSACIHAARRITLSVVACYYYFIISAVSHGLAELDS